MKSVRRFIVAWVVFSMTANAEETICAIQDGNLEMCIGTSGLPPGPDGEGLGVGVRQPGAQFALSATGNFAFRLEAVYAAALDRFLKKAREKPGARLELRAEVDDFFAVTIGAEDVTFSVAHSFSASGWLSVRCSRQKAEEFMEKLRKYRKDKKMVVEESEVEKVRKRIVFQDVLPLLRAETEHRLNFHLTPPGRDG